MFQSLKTLKNPMRYMLVTLLIFFVSARFFHGDGALSDGSKTLLTVTSFVFGFYINSLISQARNRHSKIVEGLREEGGYIKGLYYMTEASFEEESVRTVRNSIDRYLVASMDYKVYDYSKSSEEFKKLYQLLISMKLETKQQEGVWSQFTRIGSEVLKNRNRIETLVKEKVSTFEWVTIATLLALVIYFIFSINTGTTISILLTSFICTSLTMLLVILYSLDSLRWKEDKWFWRPLEELFVSLDLIPYYPKILIDLGRVKVPNGQSVRLAEYPNPYPDMNGKKVSIHK